MDIVCIAVNDINGNALPGNQLTALPADELRAAAVNGDGQRCQNHLYAAVTQTTRGTLAVVDLTGGYVVDEDKATPGINFIPVGAQPTDVAVAPDGAMTFVSSGDPNKPAIYGIDSGRHPRGLRRQPAAAAPAAHRPARVRVAAAADGVDLG